MAFPIGYRMCGFYKGGVKERNSFFWLFFSQVDAFFYHVHRDRHRMDYYDTKGIMYVVECYRPMYVVKIVCFK
jgi:hypothetical protein